MPSKPTSLPQVPAVADSCRKITTSTQLLEQLLSRRGHYVHIAKDGRQALAQATYGEFDLMLLDIHMPELDGFEVIKSIRERERNRGNHVPVIALTARSAKEDREKCLAAGMDDFLSKPIQAVDLWAAIDRAVTSRAPALPASTSCVMEKKSDVLDVQVLLAACGGDDVILDNIAVFRTVFHSFAGGHGRCRTERAVARLLSVWHGGAFSAVGAAVASTSRIRRQSVVSKRPSPGRATRWIARTRPGSMGCRSKPCGG